VPSIPASRLAPVDPRGPRFAAGLTSLVLALALLTGSGWLLAVQAVVFALTALQLGPYAVIYRRLVRPHLGPPAELEDPRPLRFAQTVGLVFTLVALAGIALGAPALTITATAAALAAAFLNAAFGVCLGCEVYLLLRRARPGAAPTDTSSTSTRTEVSA
jgi:hypothetical protein